MRDLLPFLRLYRRHSLLLGCGLTLTLFTLLAGIGLLSLSGWFLSAAAVAGVTLSGRHSFNYLLPAGAVRFLSIVRTAGRWGDRVVTHDATFRLLASLRVLFWERLAPLPTAAVQRFRQGDLLNRLVSDIDAMDHLYLRLLTPVLTALLTLCGIYLFLSHYDGRLAYLLTTSLLLIGFVLPTLLYRIGLRPGAALAQQRSALRVACIDYLDSQAERLLFADETRARAAVLNQEQQMVEAQRQMNRLGGLSTALLTLSAGCLLLLMLWCSADGVGNRGADPLIAMVIFLTLAAFEAINPLASAFSHLSPTLASARRLNEVLEESRPLTFGSQQLDTSTALALEIEDLHFAYPDAGPEQEAVLQGLNLTLAPGEKLAILGATGCGKSTLLGLITREWQTDRGQIRLGGVAHHELDECSLRRSMAVVSQRVHLFSATLAANLKLAAPGASDEALTTILRAVGLDALLEGQGLKQWLGDGGRPLSGGELRRLAMARALLHDSPLLLLDEPTEGLDPATEQAILALLLEHARNRTVLMISHRPAGLERMDRIALLENGRIRHCASHAELLALDADYRRLHQRLI